MSPLQSSTDLCAHEPESQIKLPFKASDNLKHLLFSL